MEKEIKSLEKIDRNQFYQTIQASEMSELLMSANLIGVTIITFICSILSTLAGIGGGAIFTPFFILVGQVNVKTAIFFSLIAMAGSTLSRIIYYLFKRHHHSKDRYLPNYEIIRLFLPFNGNATYIGFLLNQILPDWVILLLIVLLMTIVVSRTIRSLIKFRRELKQQEPDEEAQVEEEPEVENDQENLRGETWRDLANHLLYAVLVVGLVTFFSFMRDSSESKWVVYLSQFFLISLFGYFSIQQIRLHDLWRRSNNFVILPGDLDWSEWAINLKVVFVSSITGIFSALLGIGGGLVMNPLMLHLQIHPSVMLATSAWTSFFSVVSSTIQYLVNDPNSLSWQHSVIFLSGFLGSIAGLYILRFIENHKSVKFVISLILVLTMILCGILLVLINAVDLSQIT